MTNTFAWASVYRCNTGRRERGQGTAFKSFVQDSGGVHGHQEIVFESRIKRKGGLMNIRKHAENNYNETRIGQEDHK